MFRHLVGLFVGVVLAPLAWAAVAWSTDLLPEIASGDVTATTVLSVVVLCVVGLIGAFLVASRFSPLIAAACGTFLTALALWPVTAPDSMAAALGWLNEESFLYPSGSALAVALPLGVLLLGSAMTPTRWRALHDAAGPLGERVVAGVNRDQYRAAPREAAPSDTAPRPEGEGQGPVGDTIPEEFPDTPPAPVRPPEEPRYGGDPHRTTTPFRRGDTGAVWTPLDDEAGETRAFGDGRL